MSTGGESKRLIELPRVFGPRPALQLYNVEGAPAGKDIPFVAAFKSTPEDVAIEGWLAIQAREYSCIHSATIEEWYLRMKKEFEMIEPENL